MTTNPDTLHKISKAHLSLANLYEEAATQSTMDAKIKVRRAEHAAKPGGDPTVGRLALHLTKYVGELADGLERIGHTGSSVMVRQGYARLALWRRDRVQDARRALDLIEERLAEMEQSDRNFGEAWDEVMHHG